MLRLILSTLDEIDEKKQTKIIERLSDAETEILEYLDPPKRNNRLFSMLFARIALSSCLIRSCNSLNITPQTRRSLTQSELSLEAQQQLNKYKTFNDDVVVKKPSAFQRKLSPFSLPLKRIPNHKPVLELDRKCDFNVSHHGDLIGIVVQLDQIANVGLDITGFKLLQKNKDVTQFLNCMKTVLTHNEQQYVFNNSDTNVSQYIKLIKFMLIWACKESFLKMIGCGLAYDLNDLEVQNLPTTFVFKDTKVTETRLPTPSQCFDSFEFGESIDDKFISPRRFPGKWCILLDKLVDGDKIRIYASRNSAKNHLLKNINTETCTFNIHRINWHNEYYWCCICVSNNIFTTQGLSIEIMRNVSFINVDESGAVNLASQSTTFKQTVNINV